MDWIGDVGLIAAVASLAVGVVGLTIVVTRNSDRIALIQGLQV